jgi:hypothetical protein
LGLSRLLWTSWLTSPRSAADFSAIGLVALPVLVEVDVEVCRLSPGVVPSEMSGTSAGWAPLRGDGANR